MQISPLEEYGLRCLIQVVRCQGDRNPVTIRRISEGEGLSMAYVGKLLFQLQKAGLVQGTRGVQGGYKIAKDPQVLTVGEIFRALNSLDEVCDKYTGDFESCVHAGTCGIKPMWDKLAQQMYGFLDKITLAEVAGPRLAAAAAEATRQDVPA